jgi:hypothetical protein
MKAVSKILAGGVAFAALASAAPAAAQYYPGYGYGGGGNSVGQVLNQVLGGNQYGYNYGGNSQAAVQRCAAAVEQRINRDYGYRSRGGYGGYGGYNGYAAGNARVLGVTRIDRRNNGLRVRGVATSNAYAGGYGSPYGGQYGGQYGGGYGGYGGYSNQGGYAPQGELSFKCDIDYRGYITDVDLDRNRNNYGYRRY